MLEARYFIDADVFCEEIEQFYFDRWICAGRASSIPNPGDYFVREIGRESVIVARGPDSLIRAFYNVCRHRGTRMCTDSEGRFDGRIRCPYHGWTYALDGSLMGAPHMDERDFSRTDYPLHRVHAGVWEGHVFLNFSAEPRALSHQLAGLTERFAAWRMDELRLHRRIVYDVKANWKLIVLNYNECLHCPLVHPMLNRLTDYLGADNEAPTADYIGGSMRFRNGAETMSVDGARRRDYLPGLRDEQRKLAAYYAIYPNLLLSLHPDYMMTHTLWPKAPDRTIIECEWHFHPDEMRRPDFHADDVIEFWDQTNREDWHVSELSQAGIGSRAYTPGPYSNRENLLEAFDAVIREKAQKRR